MISTVTTSTVTTIVTATFAASLSLVAAIGLLIFLVQKEVLSSSDGMISTRLRKVLNIAIVPLLLCFLFIVFVKIIEVLN